MKQVLFVGMVKGAQSAEVEFDGEYVVTVFTDNKAIRTDRHATSEVAMASARAWILL